MATNMNESLAVLQSEMIKMIATVNAEEIFYQMMPRIEERINQVYGCRPQILEIHTPAGVSTVKGVTHEKFEQVMKIVNMDIPVYLTGKAGTGKNVICKQVADALGLEFYFTNAVTQEYKLTGFIDANGKYQETQFFKAFTKGGLFFLDEMDASIPEVLVILNAAIANRYFDFPIGKFEAHKDFRVIAAGNTTGLGANNNYTGRYQLDRASLDRFAMVNIDYSNQIELAMAGGNQKLVDFTHWFRKATDDAGVDCLFSYRTINRIANLEKALDSMDEIISISLLKGLSSDDITTIRESMNKKVGANLIHDNKYAMSFMDMKLE